MRPTTTRAGLWLLLPLVAGCVSAPTVRRPEIGVTAPDRFAEGGPSAEAVASDWWHSFGDDSLARLIEIALRENRDLEAAAARLERAEAQARIAGADLKPALSAGLGASRQRQNFVGFPSFGGSGAAPSVVSTTSSRFGVSVDTSWEVDLWGRLRAGARSAVAELQATEADLRGAKLSIAGQTTKAWFAVAEARQQAELARVSAESFRSSADQVRARFQEGIRPALDLRLALSNLAGAEALLEQRLTQEDGATRQLEVLLGRYPAGSLLRSFASRGLPDMPAPVPVGLPAEIVARRPDLAAAERRLAGADQRVLQSRKALYPRLSLTAGGGTVSDALGDLLDGDFRVWSLVSNLTQPLFQGGRLRAGVDQAEATRAEALALYAGAVLRAYSEVETALAAEQHLSRQIEHLAETAHQLVAARELAEARYRSGLGNYLIVLESQSRALTAQSALLAARLALLNNRIDLHLALGGGFTPPPEETVEDEAL